MSTFEKVGPLVAANFDRATAEHYGASELRHALAGKALAGYERANCYLIEEETRPDGRTLYLAFLGVRRG